MTMSKANLFINVALSFTTSLGHDFFPEFKMLQDQFNFDCQKIIW